MQLEKNAAVVKKFTVDIVGLKNKKHFFDFEVEKSLFEYFENDTLKDADLSVKLMLDKSETMITATVEIEGTVDLVCDRSLREFEYPLSLKERVFYKFAEKYEELSDEVATIPFNYESLDFSQLIYDSIILAIPQRVIHPDLEDEEEDALFTFSTSTDEEVEDTNEEATDPRWEKLKNLKFNKN